MPWMRPITRHLAFLWLCSSGLQPPSSPGIYRQFLPSIIIAIILNPNSMTIFSTYLIWNWINLNNLYCISGILSRNHSLPRKTRGLIYSGWETSLYYQRWQRDEIFIQKFENSGILWDWLRKFFEKINLFHFLLLVKNWWKFLVKIWDFFGLVRIPKGSGLFLKTLKWGFQDVSSKSTGNKIPVLGFFRGMEYPCNLPPLISLSK